MIDHISDELNRRSINLDEVTIEYGADILWCVPGILGDEMRCDEMRFGLKILLT